MNITNKSICFELTKSFPTRMYEYDVFIKL